MGEKDEMGYFTEAVANADFLRLKDYGYKAYHVFFEDRMQMRVLAPDIEKAIKTAHRTVGVRPVLEVWELVHMGQNWPAGGTN